MIKTKYIIFVKINKCIALVSINKYNSLLPRTQTTIPRASFEPARFQASSCEFDHMQLYHPAVESI